jgi:hypothetical protein
MNYNLDEAKDLTTTSDMNPTKWLYEHYEDLKGMDASELGPFLLRSIPQMGAFSPQAVKKFTIAVRQLTSRDDTVGLLTYITNFMMKGIDPSLGVVHAGHYREEIQIIANVITEDVNEKISPRFFELKKMVETDTGLRLVLRR